MANGDIDVPETGATDGGDIEIGAETAMTVVTDAAGTAIGAVVDDIVVATGPQGSIVDETLDVLDADGSLLLEDEIVSVYDEDNQLVAREETVAVALDDE